MKIIRMDYMGHISERPLDAGTWEAVGKVVMTLGYLPEIVVIGWCCNSVTCVRELAVARVRVVAAELADEHSVKGCLKRDMVAVLASTGMVPDGHEIAIRIPGVVFVDGCTSHDKKA